MCIRDSARAVGIEAQHRENSPRRHRPRVVVARDAVGGGGKVSLQQPPGFPLRAPLLAPEAAEKLSLPPETCVVYEDILAGIRGAKMGGFAAVGVYDRSGEGNRAKMEQEADRYVTSFKELMNGGDSFF